MEHVPLVKLMFRRIQYNIITIAAYRAVVSIASPD